MTPWLLAGSALALGLVAGSFLNVVIHRLPRGQSIVRPGSHCPSCKRPLGPLENVPLLSYLVLRGRCRGCGCRIAPRYPLVEAATGLLFAALALRYGLAAMTPLWMAFAAGLVAAALIDFDHHIIPDSISLGGLAAGLGLVPLARALDGAELLAALATSAIGALLGGGMVWSIGFVHARVAALSGRRFPHWPGEGEPMPRPSSLDYWTWFPGLGFGDVKLLAAIGAFLGPLGALETILAASLLGLLLGLAWAAVTRQFSAPFGFGPALAAAALLVALSPYHLVPGL